MIINPMKIRQAINFNILLLFLALTPRLGIFLIIPPTPEKILTPLNDSTDYDFLAQEILKGRFCSPTGEPTAFRPPLYPAFLAIIYLIAGIQNLKAVALAQVALGIFNAFLTLWAAERMTKSKMAARLAALGVALYPAFILQTVQILSEDLSRTLFLASLAFLISGMEEKKSRRLILSGIIFGIAALNKSALLAALPFLVLWVGYYWSGPFRDKLKSALLYFLFPIALLVGAWSARNAAISGGKIIPVSTNYPITFAHGVTRFSYYSNLWYGRERLMPAPDNFQELTQMRFYHGVKEELRIGREYVRKAMEFIKDHPGFMFRLTFRKTLHFWSPLIRNSRWAEIAAFVTMAPVLLLGWLGVIKGLLKKNSMRRYAILALAVALPVTLPYVLSQPDVRYRVGLIDLIWIIFAGWILAGLIQKVHPRYAAASSAPVPSSNHDASGQSARA